MDIMYIPHGGGPLPLLGDEGHAGMVQFLQQLAPALDAPEAILVVSAHWEERRPTVTGGAHPPLIYDYYGFPPESYTIAYPAPGAPDLAARIAGLLDDAGLQPVVDEERGFDHGMFVPLKLMFPAGGIPVVQLSLLRGLDPAAHLTMGRALVRLRDARLLVLGSGFSYHNLRSFFTPADPALDRANDAFQEWLIETCCDGALARDEREERLLRWAESPASRLVHPREEHLLPLHVCCGMAGLPAELVFDDVVLGKRAVGFHWKV